MDIVRHDHESALAAATALAAFVADRLRAGIAERGTASLVVSGGKTPLPFFAALSTTALDWDKVVVTLADERWVPADHADSNERLVRAHLLQNAASSARFVPLYDGSATPGDGVPAIHRALAALDWPTDVTILGMGGDGHTASLFPGNEINFYPAGADPLCLALPAPELPNVPVERMSLTATALLATRCLVLHFTGRDKQAIFEQACQPGLEEDLPVRIATLRARGNLHVFSAP